MLQERCRDESAGIILERPFQNPQAIMGLIFHWNSGVKLGVPSLPMICDPVDHCVLPPFQHFGGNKLKKQTPEYLANKVPGSLYL